MEAANFSRQEHALLKALTKKVDVPSNTVHWLRKQPDFDDMSKRERGVFLRKLGLLED